jgi:hypothetical protein
MNLRTADILSLVTSSGADINVHVSYRERDGKAPAVNGRKNTSITTATTTTILEGPAGSSNVREVTALVIRNVDSTSNTVTVKHNDGTTNVEIYKATVAAGGQIQWTEQNGWEVSSTSPTGTTLLTTTANVANAEAVADTLTNITGLTFAVEAGDSYRFRFVAGYTSAATTTGARFTVNGPAMTNINFVSRWTLTATTEYLIYGAALLAGAVQAESLTAGNMVVIEGRFTPSAAGTFAIQFSSEVTVSAITVLAGATLEIAKTVDA